MSFQAVTAVSDGRNQETGPALSLTGGEAADVLLRNRSGTWEQTGRQHHRSRRAHLFTHTPTLNDDQHGDRHPRTAQPRPTPHHGPQGLATRTPRGPRYPRHGTKVSDQGLSHSHWGWDGACGVLIQDGRQRVQAMKQCCYLQNRSVFRCSA